MVVRRKIVRKKQNEIKDSNGWPLWGRGCGSDGGAVAVRIQSLAKNYIDHLLSTVLKRQK